MVGVLIARGRPENWSSAAPKSCVLSWIRGLSRWQGPREFLQTLQRDARQLEAKKLHQPVGGVGERDIEVPHLHLTRVAINSAAVTAHPDSTSESEHPPRFLVHLQLTLPVLSAASFWNARTAHTMVAIAANAPAHAPMAATQSGEKRLESRVPRQAPAMKVASRSLTIEGSSKNKK
jgi:hypothetical protein